MPLAVTLMRFGWLTLAGMMGLSRIAFQAAGPVRMRAFLNGWKESRTKRLWGLMLGTYALVVLAATATARRRLSLADRVLAGLFLMVALGDSLLNVLPGSFSRFKETMQDQWVRRQRNPAKQTDRALFGTVNLALGLASAAIAAVVALYRPIRLRTVVAAVGAAAVITGALVTGSLREAQSR